MMTDVAEHLKRKVCEDGGVVGIQGEERGTRGGRREEGSILLVLAVYRAMYNNTIMCSVFMMVIVCELST